MTDKGRKNDLLKNESKNFNENSTQENQREEYYKEYLKLSQECKELKKGYAELTEIVNPYMDDLTGYNKELGGFDLILCVKELLQQLARKTEECEELKERLERTEEDLKYQCVDCMNVKSDRYRTAITKIKNLAEFSYRPYITCGEYNETCIVLTNILNVIEEIKEGK